MWQHSLKTLKKNHNLRRKNSYAAGHCKAVSKGLAKVATYVLCVSNALPAFENLSPLYTAAQHLRGALL